MNTKKDLRNTIIHALIITVICAILVLLFQEKIAYFIEYGQGIDLTTPALLFPAVSLIILAYTSRFLALADLVRRLHQEYQEFPDRVILAQIRNLRRRIMLIRDMTATAVICMLLCIACIFLIFAGMEFTGAVLFGISLIMIIVSLGYSVWETWISVNALNLQLHDVIEAEERKKEQKE